MNGNIEEEAMQIPTEWSSAATAPSHENPILVQIFTPIRNLSKSDASFTYPRWMSLCLLLWAFFCAFFTQYQAVGPCSFMLHASYLGFIYIEKRTLVHWLGSVLVGLGLAFSMSQIFRPNSVTGFDWRSFGIVLGIQELVVHVFFLFARFHTRLCRLSTKQIVMFCYPVLTASTYSLVQSYSPVGSQGSIGYSLWEYQSFIQIVSVFGLTGLDLIILTVATMISHVALIDLQNPLRRRFAIIVGFAIFMFTWLFGSFRLVSPYIYQKGVAETATPSDEIVQSACVLGAGDPDIENDMLARTEEVLKAGNIRFLMWSESAFDWVLYDDTEQDMKYTWQVPTLSTFETDVQRLAIQYNATLAVTYMTWAHPDDYNDDKRFNWFRFFDPDGTTVSEYAKRHPVPVIESYVIPSSMEITEGDSSSIGEYDSGICFDLDYPEFVRRGVNTGLLIQTANTWGIVGYYHGISSAFRSIENGAMLVRCGSKGPSGVWDSYGNQLAYQARSGKDVIYFEIPYNGQKVWTFYSHVGFVIDYLLYAASILYLGLVLISFRRKTNNTATLQS